MRSDGRRLSEFEAVSARLRADPRTVPLLERLSEKVAEVRAGEDRKITVFDVFGPFEVLSSRQSRAALRAYLAVVAVVSGLQEIYDISID